MLDGKKIVTGWLLWPTKTIASRSSELRKECKKASSEPLVFFAPGDVVSFAVTGDGRVLSWEPIEEELQQVAATLAEFVHGWASGELTV